MNRDAPRTETLVEPRRSLNDPVTVRTVTTADAALVAEIVLTSRRTGADNEEREPDVLLHWSPGSHPS